MIFDSHAHYDAHAFDEDRDALLSSLPAQNVCGVIDCADTLASCARNLTLCKTYPFMYMAAGVHPENARDIDLARLEQDLLPFLQYEKTVAVGEIGLDYHWLEDCPKDKQQKVFAEQLRIATAHNLPVIVHDREAHADTLQFLQKYRPRGVVHCFSGSVQTMREIVKLGMYIGLGGVVTFKNARVALEVAAAVPLDRLLLETDAPYMAPVPFRGKRCDSTLIPYAAAKIAAVRGTDTDEILRITAENARRLFGV